MQKFDAKKVLNRLKSTQNSNKLFSLHKETNTTKIDIEKFDGILQN